MRPNLEETLEIIQTTIQRSKELEDRLNKLLDNQNNVYFLKSI